MVRASCSTRPIPDRAAPRSDGTPFAPARLGERRRTIPFRMLADAFAAEDEELDPEPDRNDFAAWDPCR